MTGLSQKIKETRDRNLRPVYLFLFLLGVHMNGMHDVFLFSFHFVFIPPSHFPCPFKMAGTQKERKGKRAPFLILVHAHWPLPSRSFYLLLVMWPVC